MKRRQGHWTKRMERELAAIQVGRTGPQLAKIINEKFGTTFTDFAIYSKLHAFGVRRKARWTPGELSVIRTEVMLAFNRLRTRLQRRGKGALVSRMVSALIHVRRKQRVDWIA